MKPLFIIAGLFLMLTASIPAFASTDGIYGLNIKLNLTWDGADSGLIADTSLEYDYVYGDEAYLTYALPQTWPSFTFYGQTYNQITVDTNGNIWFGSVGSASSFNLPSNGRGPVIAAWNNDLSSYFNGGVFVQHKTNPERVIIEWQAESFTDEGLVLPNNFEVVLYQNGDIRIDYKAFTSTTAKDFGSGISSNDNSHYLSITSAYFPVYQLSGNSYGFTTSISTLQVTFAGTGNGSVISLPEGIACNTNCSYTFPTGEHITLSTNPDQYSQFAGWLNGGCSGTGGCNVTLDANSSVTATFDLKASLRSGIFYPSVQIAYNNAVSGDTIYAWDYSFSDGLTCARQDSPSVIILGGYDPTYASVIGTSKLAAPFTIKTGTVRVRYLAVVDNTQAALMMPTTLATTVTATTGPALIERSSKGCKNKKDCHDEDDDDENHHH